MKKFILSIGVVALIAGTSSCKKTYDCTCTTPGFDSITVNSGTKMSKKDAEAWCEVSEYCSLD